MLEYVFSSGTWKAGDIASICLDRIRSERHGLLAELTLDGVRVSEALLLRKLRAMDSFEIASKNISLEMGTVGSFGVQLLFVEGVRDGCDSDWSVALSRGLVTARSYDDEYDEWQNAKDVGYYREHGRSLDGVPLLDNGLFPPLNRMEVDTRRNPGRRVIRKGYVESVGHRMWLGLGYLEKFSAVDRGRLEQAGFLVRDLPGGIVEITTSAGPFVDTSTAKIQDLLRELLFSR